MVTFFQKPTCMESDACYRAPKQTFFGQPKFPFGKKNPAVTFFAGTSSENSSRPFPIVLS
jgi:hypothetical protein